MQTDVALELVATVAGTLKLPEVTILVPQYAAAVQMCTGHYVFARAASVEPAVPSVTAVQADLAQLST